MSERASEPKRKPKPNKPASQPVSQPATRQRSESGRDRKCESAKTKRKTADCQFDTVTSHLHAFTLSLSYAFIHAFTLSRAGDQVRAGVSGRKEVGSIIFEKTVSTDFILY